MEKLCIVKRRKRFINDTTIERPSILSSFFKTVKERNDVPGNLNKNKNETLAFFLNDKQTDMLKNSSYFEPLLKGTIGGYNLTMDNQDNGQIVFNLNFNETVNIKLLKPKQVCKMLQISRYFLRKLVKQNKIRSFNIGRLIRFDLNNVLDFISKSENISTSENIVNFNKET
ncbi:MAG: helix-turn-helix domain-containing protein [Candidatus Anammoxibacter sp.]